ncbi:ATP-binding protein [Streptomyces sp. WAC 04229]|uniref:ATP-binding protein n=1 Tax=Streptomyces sp. WAC 04229 TaxID=2203206 RepID=UPI003D72DE3A
MEADAGRLRPPFSAATARAHVRDLLLARTPDMSPVVIDDVLLVATELITNAQRHGGGLVAFDARLTEDTITITVTDASPALPRTTPRNHPAAPGGFGWPLIHQISRHISVTPTTAGKTIRAVIGIGRRGRGSAG